MSIVKKTKTSLLTGLAALVLSCGCSNSPQVNQPDGGPRDGGYALNDGGVRPDGGSHEDGGPIEDGGPQPDGSVFDDGGLDGSVPNPDGGPDGGVVNLELHFPNVGAGNAVFGRFSKNQNPITFLYDCGESTAPLSALVKYLKKQMGESLLIDSLIISSKRTSSLKGCLQVLNNFEVGNIYLHQVAYDYISSSTTLTDLKAKLDNFQPTAGCKGNSEISGGLCMVKKDSPFLEKEGFSLDLIVPYDGAPSVFESYDPILLRAKYGQESFLLAADCNKSCYERVQTSWSGIAPALEGNTLQIHEVVKELNDLPHQNWLAQMKNLVITGDTAKKVDTTCQDSIKVDIEQLLGNYPNLISHIYRSEYCAGDPNPTSSNYLLIYNGLDPPEINTVE